MASEQSEQTEMVVDELRWLREEREALIVRAQAADEEVLRLRKELTLIHEEAARWPAGMSITQIERVARKALEDK